MYTKAENIKFKFLAKEPYSSNDTSYVYKNPQGECWLIENGAQLTNTAFKQKKFTMRYSVSRKKTSFLTKLKLPSENGIDEFDVIINFSAKVEDPVVFINSDLDSDLEKSIKDRVGLELRQIAKQFIIDKYNNLESAIDKGLNSLNDFNENGLKVDVTATVEISEEIKRKIKQRRDEIETKKHNRQIKEMDQKWEKADRDKEFEEFSKIFAGTPVTGYLMMFKTVDQLREHLLSEYKDKRKTIQSLREKYLRGEIDEVQLRKGEGLFQGGDTIINKMDKTQLENSDPQRYINQADTEKPTDQEEREDNSFARSAQMKNGQDLDTGWGE